MRRPDALTITAGDDGGTIDLTAHGGGTILLEGVEVVDLDAEDFQFAPAEPPADGL